MLVEGNSIRGIERMTNVSKVAILKLVADLGAACASYHDQHVRNLNPRRLELDEIWSFVGCKQKNLDSAKLAKGWGGRLDLGRNRRRHETGRIVPGEQTR
jgi:hypothetical protein